MTIASADATARFNMLSVLRIRNFALLWSGQAVSQIGDGLFYMAQIWLVLQMTGSALTMGTVLILSLLPRLLFQLIGGVSVDRYDRRRMLLASDMIRSMVTFVFALLVATQRIELIHIYLLSVIFGIVGAFFWPAKTALIPNIVPHEGLVAANSLTNLTQQLSQILGPAIAGALIALPSVGVAGVSFFNAASFALGALGISLMRLPKHLNGSRKSDASFWHELRDGFRYLFNFQTLVIILFLAMGLNFALGPFDVILPLFAKNVLGQGAEGMGLLMSSFGVGAVIGSIIIGMQPPRTHRGIFLFISTLLAGAFFAGIGVIPVLGVVFVLLVIFGVLLAIVNTIALAILQEMTADEYRGRILSLTELIASGLMPVALAVGGGLADTIGPGMVITASGVLVISVSMIGLLFKEIRTLQ